IFCHRQPAPVQRVFHLLNDLFLCRVQIYLKSVRIGPFFCSAFRKHTVVGM
ncbi:hypothetical protein COCVIDRAFT_114812, partial [Bipolaris victoriae FI3]